MSGLLSIVLVVRDRAPLTLRALQALSRLPDTPPFEVVIVDDASTDETPDLLASLDGDVRVLRNEAPVGFGPGCDQAIAAARGDTLVLLHDDAVPCDGWLGALRAALDDNAVAVALPRSLSMDGAFLAESQWLALALRRTAWDTVGGFAAASEPGRPEKASLLSALRAAGQPIGEARDALLLLVPAS